MIEGNQLLYIFVVDRSGSMGTEHRMDITKMALKLFVKSLPLGSKFSILSFGSRCEFMHRVTSKLFNTMSDIFEYNDETLEDVLRRINYFDSNFGGTEILEPLQLCVKLKASRFSTRQRRVFLLTDGEVDNKNEIFEFVRNHND